MRGHRRVEPGFNPLDRQSVSLGQIDTIVLGDSLGQQVRVDDPDRTDGLLGLDQTISRAFARPVGSGDDP